MKTFNKPLALGAVLLGLTFGAGCGTVVEGDGSGVVGVDVYGADQGPWDYGTVEYGGVGHVRPPFHAEDNHAVVDAHRGGDDRGHAAAPVRSAPVRSAPSIPNHARPSGGGGGGGHPSGGGGHPSSGDHKH